MKKYQIVIIGFLIVPLVVFVIPNKISAEVRARVIEVLVTNFPQLQQVLVTNTEPINVNIVNQGQGLPPKVVTFWDNECGTTVTYSSVIETNGYKRLSIHAPNMSRCWKVQVSLDGVNWLYQDTGSEICPWSFLQAYEIMAPYYRLEETNITGTCLTVKGYLVP